MARVFWAERHELSGVGLPGVIHNGERIVLGWVQTHLVGTEASVFDESEVVFPSCDSACAAAYRLEICVRDTAYGLDGRQQGGAHTVAPGDVFRSAFCHEHWVLAYHVGEIYGVEIVAALRRGYDFHAVVQFLAEPERSRVVLRDAEQQGDIVVGAYFCEGSGGVSGRGDYEYLVCSCSQSSAY